MSLTILPDLEQGSPEWHDQRRGGIVERWGDIPGWEGFYQASDLGRIKSVSRWVATSTGYKLPVKERILTSKTVPAGYLVVGLWKDGHRATRFVHRLVLLAFAGYPNPKDLQACHDDDDKSNNCLSNLRWGTPSENMQDQVRNGRNHHASKTHCKNGHEFTPENTRIPPTGNQKRSCRACCAINNAKRDRRNPVAS